MNSLRIGVGMLVSGTLAACGPGDGGAVPIGDLENQLASAECEVLVRCHFVSDQAFCRSWADSSYALGGFNSLRAIVAGVNAGRIDYDAVAARACVDSFRGIACADLFRSPLGGACQNAFKGTVADNGACDADPECMPGSFCSRPGGFVAADTCAGTCARGGTLCNDDTHCVNGQVCDLMAFSNSSNGTCVTARPPGAANEACGTNDRCQPGLACSTSGGASLCVALRRAGEPCNLFGDCVEDLVCVQSDDGGSSTCMAPAAKGEACQARGQCGSPFLSSILCDSQHVCVDAPTSGPCVGTIQFGQTSCNVLSSYCDTSGDTPTCVPYRALGAACDVNADSQCGFSAIRCEPSGPGSVTGTCVAPISCVP